MWKRFLSLMTLTTLLSLSPSLAHPIVTKVDSIVPEGDWCDLVTADLVLIPCRPFEQMPVRIPPVEVDCTARSFGEGNTNRCTNVV